jgi:uncharacterized protein YcfL
MLFANRRYLNAECINELPQNVATKLVQNLLPCLFTSNIIAALTASTCALCTYHDTPFEQATLTNMTMPEQDQSVVFLYQFAWYASSHLRSMDASEGSAPIAPAETMELQPMLLQNTSSC